MQKIKQKTRSGVAKRFKITASGKVLRRSQNMRHRRRIKSRKPFAYHTVKSPASGQENQQMLGEG